MKKYIIIILDVIIGAYLIFAITAFNNPEQQVKKCTKVNINITDESTYGFLDAKEIKSILQKNNLYPIEQDMDDISPRVIEETLRRSPFVNTAECSKTMDGHVMIDVTQRSPLVRIKSQRGEDYYIDENGGIMPNSKYTSDLIIVTGAVSKTFAQRYIAILANTIMQSDLWRNQIEQINVLQDHGIELVPRVGDHIIFLGYLPESNRPAKRQQEIPEFVNEKLNRLEKFYIHGLDSVGWNKYERIDLQFANQIICKKHPQKEHPILIQEPEVHEADLPSVEAAAPKENSALNQDNKPKADENKPKATDNKPAKADDKNTKGTDNKPAKANDNKQKASESKSSKTDSKPAKASDKKQKATSGKSQAKADDHKSSDKKQPSTDKKKTKS